MAQQIDFTEIKLTQLQSLDAEREAIQNLFAGTFFDSEGPSEGEFIGRLVGDLIDAGDTQDIRCFVALVNQEVVGSIFFSKLWSDTPIEIFLLSPVAVHTAHQGKGVGQKLIGFALDKLREDGVKLVFTYGDPRFYSKAGFGYVSEGKAKAPYTLTYPEGWLGLALDDGDIEPLKGTLRCVEAFRNPRFW